MLASNDNAIMSQQLDTLAESGAEVLDLVPGHRGDCVLQPPLPQPPRLPPRPRPLPRPRLVLQHQVQVGVAVIATWAGRVQWTEVRVCVLPSSSTLLSRPRPGMMAGTGRGAASLQPASVSSSVVAV